VRPPFALGGIGANEGAAIGTAAEGAGIIGSAGARGARGARGVLTAAFTVL